MKRLRKKILVPKICYFCEKKEEPHFSNATVLQRFLTERGKIIGRARSGICSKHQRRLGLTIKYARHLALLPFVMR